MEFATSNSKHGLQFWSRRMGKQRSCPECAEQWKHAVPRFVLLPLVIGNLRRLPDRAARGVENARIESNCLDAWTPDPSCIPLDTDDMTPTVGRGGRSAKRLGETRPLG